MNLLAVLPILITAQADVYRLDLGPAHLRGKTITVSPNTLHDLRSGSSATLRDIAAAADGASFVFVGESHDKAEHHRFQADVIRALVERGRSVIVGMEMFPHTAQTSLDLWSLGRLSEEQFIERSEWKTVWGFDYSLYKPIFDVVREHKLRLTGLNVPRELVRKVSRGGAAALTPEDQADMPDLDTTNAEHRALFNAMIGGAGGHGMGDNVYAGQVLWDTAMAHYALRYWSRTPRTKDTVMVIIAGSGHMMYGLGINYRLSLRTPERILNVLCLDAPPSGTTVARSIADFSFASSAQSTEGP
ncbi:MAG: ChaN family lipoprotein [Fimbriimonadia bacterium]|jgi:uncharacterized iron-regulated protein